MAFSLFIFSWVVWPANSGCSCLIRRYLPFFTNQALIQQLEDMKENLEKTETSGQQTVDVITASNGDPLLVQEELAAVSQKYDAVLRQLHDKQAQLEQAIDQGVRVQDKLDEIQAWTTESDEAVKSWEPISTDPVTAQKQLEQLQVCMDSKCSDNISCSRYQPSFEGENSRYK